MNFLVLAVSIILFSLIFFIFFLFFKKKLPIVYKIASILIAVLFFVWFLLSGGSLLENALLQYSNPFENKFLCVATAIACWLTFINTVLLTIYPLFKYNVLKNLAKTFSLLTSIWSIAFLNQLTFNFTGTTSFNLTSALISVFVGLLFAYSLHLCITNRGFYIPKSELKEFFVGLIIVFVFSIPPYMPKLMFGNVGINLAKELLIFHRIYIYLSFIFLFGLYFLLKTKEANYCRMVLLYISLVTLISYCRNYDFSIFATPTNWPLHLCNTAMFIIPLCLLFKWEKLFYFTFFINVVGAFFAMLMPNYSAGLSAVSSQVVAFWINHIMAFIMPVLIVLLKVYPRPKLKHFIYSMIAFAVYFGLVLFINAWFSNFKADVDFFFLNSDFIVAKLGTWAENTRNIVWSFKIKGLTFTFYPLYQFLFFLVYILLGLAMWFLYVWIFNIEDFYATLKEKNRKIKLDELILKEKYNKKEVNECMNKNSCGKLVLKDVSKRYGNNKTFAVENISFEVKEGEILGFLGPNGAGKSTIIKCVVGIQPATSGDIEINGYDIEKQPVKAKMQFGFVPDHYALYENLTGREYVNYIADLYGVSIEDRNERLFKLIKNLNMQDSFDNQIKTYSHGMKQKIAIMSALVHNPKLWILDEPLTGLDPISIYQVKECMRNHAKDGNIVFFSSHIIDIVEKLCTRIIILNNHKIEADITIDKLRKKGVSLEEFYLKTIGQKLE